MFCYYHFLTPLCYLFKSPHCIVLIWRMRSFISNTSLISTHPSKLVSITLVLIKLLPLESINLVLFAEALIFFISSEDLAFCGQGKTHCGGNSVLPSFCWSSLGNINRPKIYLNFMTTESQKQDITTLAHPVVSMWSFPRILPEFLRVVTWFSQCSLWGLPPAC